MLYASSKDYIRKKFVGVSAEIQGTALDEKSGVHVQDSCIQEFRNLIMNRKYRYIVFSLSADKKEVYVYKTAARHRDFNDLVEDLVGPSADAHAQSSSCRYVIFDADLLDSGLSSQDTVILILWCPENAPIKEKMVYASSKGAFKQAMSGLTKEIQATERRDLLLSKVMAKLL